MRWQHKLQSNPIRLRALPFFEFIKQFFRAAVSVNYIDEPGMQRKRHSEHRRLGFEFSCGHLLFVLLLEQFVAKRPVLRTHEATERKLY